MKVLKNPNSLAVRVLGLQHAESGLQYRESRFVITDGEAKYNTLTGEAVYQADERELIERWFMVPAAMDEHMLAHLIRSKALLMEQGPGQNIKHRFIIFLTTACNANCEYCFEQGMKKMYMTEQTAADVADYITEHCNRTVDNIIRLFGGEPLVNIAGINALTDRLRDNGVSFHCDMFTNGDKLSQVSTDTMKDRWHVQKIQLTADDVGAEYDKIKGLPSGAWDSLTGNMKRISDAGIRVNLRIHVHPGKGTEAPKRVVDAVDLISGVHRYAVMLYETASKEDYDDLLSVEDYIAVREKKRPQFPGIFYGHSCMADNRKNACITPDGHLSPCEHYPYGQDYGSIYEKGYDQKVLSRWAEKQKNYCEQCVLYPSCGVQHMCPAQSNCTEAEVYYKTEKIKRAMRARI